MSLVELNRYAHKVQADLARLKLQDEGIHAVLMDEGLNSLFGAGGLVGVRLMVLDEDRERAASILASLE